MSTSEIEIMNNFNAELSSIYEVKPPISKGKMTAVTKAALKCCPKFYKQVVHSVEKFIQKCKPNYKVPGLYVIDSIVRQSRHQYGIEKDCFSSRFAKNIQATFVHLYRCPEEDKAKVIRVLNLWQKNNIFPPEVIQPLFDLADPNNPIWETINISQIEAGSGDGSGFGSTVQNNGVSGSSNNSGHFSGGGLGLGEVKFNKELLDYDYEEEDESQPGGSGSGNTNGGVHTSNNTQQQQANAAEVAAQTALASFDALGSILTNPEVLRQLQTLQEQMAAAQAQQQQQQPTNLGYLTPEQERQRKLAELNKQEAAFDQRLAQTVATQRLPFEVDCDLPLGSSPSQDHGLNNNQLVNHAGGHEGSNEQGGGSTLLPPAFFQQLNPASFSVPPPTISPSSRASNLNTNNPFGIPIPYPGPNVGVPPPSFLGQHQQELSQVISAMYSAQMEDGNSGFPRFNESQAQLQHDQRHHMSIIDSSHPPIITIDDNEDHRDRERRRRSRSGERRRNQSKSGSPSRIGGRRQRSTSRSRGRRNRYRTTRSRDRDRRSEKDAEREREKERLRKGFPPPKREHISVCSTTLWVGHLSKLVSQEELSDSFGAYGDIVSIEVISSRGCAFVVMNRRQDAYRALDRLKNTKMQGKTITLAWAPGKGMKGRDWKDYWEVDQGVSFIPWNKLKEDTDLEEFEDGGCVDEDTLPDFLKNRPKKQQLLVSPGGELKEGETSGVTPGVVGSIGMTNNLGGPNGTTLLGAALVEAAGKSGDTDSRAELMLAAGGTGTDLNTSSGLLTNTPTVSTQGIQPPQFGMTGGVGLMGVAPMGMNPMMMPPPLMAPMGVPSPFGFSPMPMMGPFMSNPNPMNQPGEGNPMNPPLMNDMPPPLMQNQPPINNKVNMENSNSGFPAMEGQRMNNDGMDEEENRDSRPERRERKRSRFDNPDEQMAGPPGNNRSPGPGGGPGPMFERSGGPGTEERPLSLFERLKSLAEGSGFNDNSSNNDENCFQGGPGPGPLFHGSPRMGGPGHGPRMRGGPPGFSHRGHAPFGPRGGRPPFMGDRPQGSPWLDGGGGGPPQQNPFLNPNPFEGNPFVQNSMNENPFDIGPPPPHRGGGRGGGRHSGEFFDRPFKRRGGGRGRGGGGPPDGDGRRNHFSKPIRRFSP